MTTADERHSDPAEGADRPISGARLVLAPASITTTPRVKRTRRSARLAFVASAIRHPGQVGAVLPSSAALAQVLASVVPQSGHPVVVELGPGTGAVTTVIAERLPHGSRHLAVELDPTMSHYLADAHPDLEVIQGNATNLDNLLSQHDVYSADAIVSGLPWALFDPSTQRAILGQVADVVGPHGAFATFAYLPGMALATARRFRTTLHASFEEVVTTRTTWRNLPPAFAYICRRPRPRQSHIG